ncbi:MAG: trigger factor [Phycisphaerales bacterium]|nr:MAG: trigger factor [Phycisphaerales bacterium]
MAEATVNDVKIEDAGPARKRLTITIPVETIAEKIDDSLATLMAKTALPGFRKGRAPRHLLERRFGEAVRAETKNQLMADAYASAIEEHEIKPVGEPEPVEPMDELEIEPGQPLTFSLHVEVVPEFEVPPLDSVEIKKPILEIEDEHIEAEKKRQCRELGEPSEIEQDFQGGDRLLGYATVSKEDDEEPFFRSDEVVITFPEEEDEGKGQVLGLLIDDLAALLKDRKVGDQLTIKTSGPEHHEREDIRGKKLTIEFEIRGAQRITPATIEEVIRHYDMASEEILREQVKLALEQRRDEEQATAMREQVFEYLLEHVDFELPEKLSAAQVERSLERHRLEMLYRGMTPDEVEKRLAEIRGESEYRALGRLKLSFILHKLAQEFTVEVSDQEINGRIAAIAAQRGVRPDQLRAELVQSDRLNQVAIQLREHKTADRIVQQAKVTDISADEWRKMVEAKAAEKPAKSGKKKSKKSKTDKPQAEES